MIAEDLQSLAFPIDQLSTLEGNPRKGNVEAVKRSYERFGQRKAIVARHRTDGTNEVISGNHQLAAAKALGWQKIAVTWADDLSDDEARGFALADNRSADLGTYDEDLLAEMLSYVADDADLLAATGYDQGDIDKLIGVPAGDAAPDQTGELADQYAVVVTCLDEAHQLLVIEQLTDLGLSVKALVA